VLVIKYYCNHSNIVIIQIVVWIYGLILSPKIFLNAVLNMAPPLSTCTQQQQ